jgi:hypothetical protein
MSPAKAGRRTTDRRQQTTAETTSSATCNLPPATCKLYNGEDLIMDGKPTILCLGSYFKGNAFIRMCKSLGAKVILVAKEDVKDEPWARESIDEIFLMPDLTIRPDIFHAVS